MRPKTMEVVVRFADGSEKVFYSGLSTDLILDDIFRSGCNCKIVSILQRPVQTPIMPEYMKDCAPIGSIAESN